MVGIVTRRRVLTIVKLATILIFKLTSALHSSLTLFLYYFSHYFCAVLVSL